MFTPKDIQNLVDASKDLLSYCQTTLFVGHVRIPDKKLENIKQALEVFRDIKL